jgi:hypothetical protein
MGNNNAMLHMTPTVNTSFSAAGEESLLRSSGKSTDGQRSHPRNPSAPVSPYRVEGDMSSTHSLPATKTTGNTTTDPSNLSHYHRALEEKTNEILEGVYRSQYRRGASYKTSEQIRDLSQDRVAVEGIVNDGLIHT